MVVPLRGLVMPLAMHCLQISMPFTEIATLKPNGRPETEVRPWPLTKPRVPMFRHLRRFTTISYLKAKKMRRTSLRKVKYFRQISGGREIRQDSKPCWMPSSSLKAHQHATFEPDLYSPKRGSSIANFKCKLYISDFPWFRWKLKKGKSTWFCNSFKSQESPKS